MVNGVGTVSLVIKTKFIGLKFYKQVKKAELSEYQYILILITIDHEKLYKNTIKKGKQSVKL